MQDFLWGQEYGLDELQKGMEQLFPQRQLDFQVILEEILNGNLFEAFKEVTNGCFADVSAYLNGFRQMFLWLLMIGILSAVLSHFISIFEKHQIAELSFLFLYLLTTTLLLKSFQGVVAIASETMTNILLFVKLLVPTYLVTVGVATGTTTAGLCYQVILLLVYCVQKLLLDLVLPLTYTYLMISLMNGVWMEEKLKLLMELLEKVIQWILKAALGMVTGVSVFQSALAPVLDMLKTTAWQKAIGALPGIGNTADGVVGIVLGSAMVVKNTVGVVLLILLVGMCATPLLRIFATALLLKSAAAFMGMVSDKRITACANKAGEASMLLFKTAATAMLLFFVSLAVVVLSTRRIV